MRKLFLLFLISFCALSCYNVQPIEKYYGKDFVVIENPGYIVAANGYALDLKSSDSIFTVYIHPFDAQNIKIGDTLK